MGALGKVGSSSFPSLWGVYSPGPPTESLELRSLQGCRVAGSRALSSLVGTCSGIPPGAFQLLCRTVEVASHLPTDL